ncbi:MAG: DJ-1/PfpI family protein [Elusimicrobiota bacterium]|jgi:protease I|nr:DJ-1/PfpI family protein [Elusimicrobiota bacterium]
MNEKKLDIKVGFIIANKDFRNEEYFEPRKVLEKAGLSIVTIAMEKGLCIGKLGGEVFADVAIKDVKIQEQNFSAIIFVGGSGSKIYWHNEFAQNICRLIIEKYPNKILAAICSSVATLAFAGVLKNIKANSYQSEREIIKEYGAILMDDDIVVDVNDKHKIITANGPKVAKLFGEEILKHLN